MLNQGTMHIYIHTYIQTLYILCFLQTLQELFLFPLNKAHQYVHESVPKELCNKKIKMHFQSTLHMVGMCQKLHLGNILQYNPP